MAKRGEVLVVIMPTKSDMKIACEQNWYRIPSDQVERLKQRDIWEPKWLAFYQPKVFGDEAFAVNYYASIRSIQQVCRHELFPDEPQNSKSQKRYYKINIRQFKSEAQQVLMPQRILHEVCDSQEIFLVYG